MKTRFRVYESHLSFALQFLSDFGLYGCGWIELSENTWRRGDEDEAQEEQINLSFKLSPYHRQSRMPLELDVESHEIQNRHRLTARNIHHKLSIPASPQPPEPLVISVRELWEDERRRRIARGLPPSPDVPQDLSAGSRGKGGDWVAEARWWEEIEKRIARERDIPPVSGDDDDWTRWVMTTFESVEALWQPQHRTWKPAQQDNQANEAVQFNPYGLSSQGGKPPQSQREVNAEVDVDESLLSSQELTLLIEQEEIEAVQQQKEQEEDIDNLRQEEAMEDVPLEDLDASPQRAVSGYAHNVTHQLLLIPVQCMRFQDTSKLKSGVG